MVIIAMIFYLTNWLLMFVHIRGRGTYSMLEWIGMHNTIFQTAKDLGQNAIALTDIYWLYGVVDFYSKAKSFEMKPLLGIELPYTSHFSTLTLAKWTIKQLGTITLLVKDNIWYHNLLRIVWVAYENVVDEIPCIDSQILAQYSEWIIAVLWGLWSVADVAISIQNDDQALYDYINNIKDILWKENVVLDITAQLYTDYPILQKLNTTLIEYGKKEWYNMVTSNGYCYPTLSQKWAYETALAIKDGKRNYDPDARKVLGAHHILSENEVRSILQNNWIELSLIDILVDATVTLADSCNVKITLWQALFPNYDTPNDMKELYTTYQDWLVVN